VTEHAKSMNDLLRAATRRNVVAVTEPEPPAGAEPVTKRTRTADAGAGGGHDDHEQRGRDHPLNTAIRDAFRGRD
jgi:hypothetical protein